MDETLMEVDKTGSGNKRGPPEIDSNINKKSCLKGAESKSVENAQVTASNSNNNLADKNSGKQVNAKINLDKLENLPDNINQIIIASTNINCKLASLNPIKVEKQIQEICGKVKNAEPLRSGGIMITVRNQEQISKIKSCTSFINVQITSKIAWTTQFTYRRLWCPQIN